MAVQSSHHLSVIRAFHSDKYVRKICIYTYEQAMVKAKVLMSETAT